MMKKIIIPAVVLLAGGYVGSSYYSGKRFATYIETIPTQLATQPLFQVDVSTINQGLLSSSGELVLSLNLDELGNESIAFHFPWQAKHYPWSVALVSQADITVEEGFSFAEMVGLPYFELKGKVTQNKLDYQYQEQHLEHGGAFQTVLEGLFFKGSYHFQTAEQKVQAGIKKYHHKFSDEFIAAAPSGTTLRYAFELNDILFENQSVGTAPYQVGQGQLSIGDGRMKLPSHADGWEWGKMHIGFDIHHDAQEFKVNNRWDLGAVRQLEEGQETTLFEAGVFHYQFSQIDGKAVAQLIEVLQEQAAEITTNERLYLEPLIQILRGSPRFDLVELSYKEDTSNQPRKELTGWMQLHGDLLPTNLLELIVSGEVGGDQLLPLLSLELTFKNLPNDTLAVLSMLWGVPIDEGRSQNTLTLDKGDFYLNGEKFLSLSDSGIEGF